MKEVNIKVIFKRRNVEREMEMSHSTYCATRYSVVRLRDSSIAVEMPRVFGDS
jgi:hypothetical protein